MAASTWTVVKPPSMIGERFRSRSRMPRRANVSSVGASGARLWEVVEIRTRGMDTLDRIELERFPVRGVHGLRHPPVFELGVAAHVPQVGDLLAAIDIALVGWIGRAS